MADAMQPSSTFYDDGLRPKSFLRDEVDEFNRVLAELLESRQRPEPLATSKGDSACCSSWSEDDKIDVFQIAQQDHWRTDDLFVNNDFKLQNIGDIRHGFIPDSQPYVTHWTAELDDDDDDYADVADDNDYTLLRIVEEGDLHQMAKSGNVRTLPDISTSNDLFNEVCTATNSD